MKLTKSTLQRIIKEEHAKLMSEDEPGFACPFDFCSYMQGYGAAAPGITVTEGDHPSSEGEEGITGLFTMENESETGFLTLYVGKVGDMGIAHVHGNDNVPEDAASAYKAITKALSPKEY